MKRTGDWAIDLKDISKTYPGRRGHKVKALRDVRLQVGAGEIFGLLGPNGAGKSTLVKIMLTVVRPNRASGTVLGYSLGDHKAMQRIGYLPEGHRFPPYLSGAALLDYFGRLSKMPRASRRKKIDYWFSRMGMSKWKTTRCGSYSKGMLQRVGIAQALMHDPDLIILDEPTDGVDPLGRRTIRTILEEQRSLGKTIFINSHILSELELVCDRVAILMEGQVASQGTLEELTAASRSCEIICHDLPDRVVPEITRLGGHLEQPNHILCHSDQIEEVNAMLDLLRANEVLIESVRPRRWSLEDVFVNVASGSETEQ